MALKPCKECKKEVSSTAKSCPHCGAKEPGIGFKERLWGGLVIVGIAVAIVAACTGGDKEGDNSSSPTTSSQLPSAIHLDEKGLIAAIGSPVIYEYPLDNGKGLSFRADGEPPFSIEFRGHVNVAWEGFRDPNGKFDAMNAENKKWAEQALVYAIGQEAAAKVMAASEGDKPLSFTQLGHTVSMMEPMKSPPSVLVTIKPPP